jgi:hypothetical protein
MRYPMMIAAALMLTGAGTEPVAGPSLIAPDWMAGAWVEVKGDRWTEEYWTASRGGIQLGASRSGKGNVLDNWEQARIAAGSDGRLTFFASPGGQPPVTFRMVRQDMQSVEFENPDNDYPTRIRYWREGGLLKAEISGPGGANATRWTYRRM